MNIEKAEQTYREVQRQIAKGDLYELYGDVERLIPNHIKPECIEKVVEIELYVPEKKSPRKKAADTQGTKRKRNDDMMRNIPEGACTGFVSVRDLIAKQVPKPKKVKIGKDFEACGKDDETDEDIESGRIMAPPRRTQSAAAGSSRRNGIEKGSGIEKGRGKLRKYSTLGSKSSKSRKKRAETPTLAQFDRQGSDDSDDVDIEQGAIAAHRQKTSLDSRPLRISGDPQHASPGKSPSVKKKPRILSRTPDPASRASGVGAIVELTDSEREKSPLKPGNKPLSSSTRMTPNPPDEDMGWIVNDDEDNLQIEIVDSSPSRSNGAHLGREDESLVISAPVFKPKAKSRGGSSLKHKTSVDDSIVEIIEPESPHNSSKGKEIAYGHDESPTTHSPIYVPSSPSRPTGISGSMAPPALPRNLNAVTSPSFSMQHTPPMPTYPPRQAKRRRLILDDDETESLLHMDDIDKPLHRRLRRIESTPPKKVKAKRSKPTIVGSRANFLFEGEAVHSGDEISEGQSNSEDDIESESDRQFIKDSPLTQASQSYDQSQVYRHSLMTQFPAGGGPAFARAPDRPKPFGRNVDRTVYRRGLPSSSPPLPNEDLDGYEFGSFVVEDDDFR